MPNMHRLLLAIIFAMMVLVAHSASNEALQRHQVSADSALALQGIAHRLRPTDAANPSQTVAENSFLGRSASDSRVEASPRRRRSSISENDSADTHVMGQSSHSSSVRTAHKREVQAPTPLTFTPAGVANVMTISLVAGESDDEFASRFCIMLTGAITSIRVIANEPITRYFAVPACLSTAEQVMWFSATLLHITRVDAFPSSIREFTCGNCSFAAAAGTGFDADGNVQWSEWWERWVSLTQFEVSLSDISGTLPTVIPELTSFALHKNPFISGPLSSTLFESYTTYNRGFSFEVSYCNLSGEIPPSLFLPFADQDLGYFFFSVEMNQLSGPLLSEHFAFLQTSGSVEIILRDNKLDGSLPETLFPRGLSLTDPKPSLILALNNNEISGVLPWGFLSNLQGINKLSLNLANNRLSSTLPLELFNNVTWTSTGGDLLVDLSDNRLEGAIPSTFISTLVANQNVSTSTLSLLLSGNQLSGRISPYLFLQSTSLGTFQPSKLTLDLSDNALTDSIPNLLGDFLPINATVTLTLNNNRLSGTFPHVMANALASNTGGVLQIAARNNSLIGDAPTNCNGLLSVVYDVSFNQLTGTIPSTTNCRSFNLNVSSNFGLSGSIPPSLFNISVLTLSASQTNLSDLPPPQLYSSRASIDLSSTKIDFCSAPFSASAPTFYTASNCILDRTSACNCTDSYTGCSIDCTPLAVPHATSGPSPPTTTSPISTVCHPNTRPSLEFVCINGIWTATSTSSPTLTIPSGAGVIVVEGNVSSSTIVINGIGSKIVIGGCSTNLSSIIIELSPEEVKQLETRKSLQDLVTLSNTSQSCSADLNSVTLTTRTKGCRKVSTEKVVSNNSLGVYFTVNSSGCNTWWIVLVSVVAALVVIGVIVAIVLRVLWTSNLEKKAAARLAA